MSKNRQAVIQLLKDMNGNWKNSLCIPVGNPVICYLRPVSTAAGYQNESDVQHLTEWRNANPKAFLTEFVATFETTSAWLANLVHNKSNKILFMLDDLERKTFGYMGMDYINWEKNHGEADAIVRGREMGKGVMKECIHTMFKWASEQLGLSTIDVRVLSDNPALAFYHKVGFKEYQRIPLKRHELPGKVSWEEENTMRNAERWLVYLKLEENIIN